ncbi:MAG: gamma-glutamyltransferase [Alphaproteobacteria bacterium]|nr:gamma-glutamyltransferase [Alphaproteobacteria bacterium]
MSGRLFVAVVAVWLGLAPAVAHAASAQPAGAENGMVVSAHRLASDVGVAVMTSGGNAVDAAVAVAYALAVTFPEAGNIGGGGFMTIRLADGREAFIDFRETAPAAATATMFQDAAGNVVPGLSTRSFKAVAVPGTVAGLELARERYGSRPRAELIDPAVRLARDGFVLDHADAEFLARGAEDFARDPAARAIFLTNGRPWRTGERLVQADLARMLAAIAAGGPDAFYRGEAARRIVAASSAQGGILSLADFANYRAKERAPLTCSYRGYRIISAPPPSSGGTVICQTLAILEPYDLGKLGFMSASTVHLTVEALRRAYRDRNLQLGDPDFIPVDTARLLAPDYVARLRASIDPARATPSLSLGAPAALQEGKSTTHLSVVDKAGNAVSLTYTLNDWFGARIVAGGTGILLNNEMDDFSAKPGVPNFYKLVEGTNNAVAPGKRPLSSMSPTIVTRDGKLELVIGTPGGSRIPTGVLQVMMNIIDHGMTLTEAVDAPRIHAQWLPDVISAERFALSAETAAALEGRGHVLEPMSFWNQIAAIKVGTPGGGLPARGAQRLYGAIDPRLPTGTVAGY